MQIDSLILSQYGLGCSWDNLKVSKARTGLFSLLNKTSGIVDLIGHSGENVFTEEEMIVSSDTSLLSTSHIYIMSSNTGNFSKDYLSKSFLLMKNTGAVAVIANSGVTYLTIEEEFQKYFITFLSQMKSSTIGELFNAAIQELTTKGMKITF